MSQPVDLRDVVRQTITVAADRDLAFRVFTEQFGAWWPKQYSIGEAEMADFVLEPRAGGRWYEVGVDGSECDIGRVTAFESPARVVLAWHLDGDWRFDPDPDHASEVEIRFVAEDGDRTRVELEHRYFERHGAGAAAVRGAVESQGGWTWCLAAYVELLPA
ncbi:SRPBCC family protein [Actinomadura litoris]|uniref:SRPBCC family protein n=1 Tax=Actinomadura litoris TaxID=2678616 RepID=UPI001FA6F2DC|nr:SRPBCC family protein [Actinomadura litoris]